MRCVRANLKVNGLEADNMADALDLVDILVATGRGVPARSWIPDEAPSIEDVHASMKAQGFRQRKPEED